MQFLLTNRLVLPILISLFFILSSCGFFGKEKYTANLDHKVKFSLEYKATEDELVFQQIIIFSNKDNWLTLNDDTQTKDLRVHLDSLPVNNVQTPMFFIYNLYLGWAVLNYETLQIHKDFAQIPKEQALLTKLRLMKDPIWELNLENENNDYPNFE